MLKSDRARAAAGPGKVLVFLFYIYRPDRWNEVLWARLRVKQAYYNNLVYVSALPAANTSQLWMIGKRCLRKWSCLIFAWTEWGKPRKQSGQTVSTSRFEVKNFQIRSKTVHRSAVTLNRLSEEGQRCLEWLALLINDDMTSDNL
jgi:hypothetical protein